MLQTEERIAFENIGEVLFRRSKRCKRLSIHVKPVKGVEVVFPPGYPIRKAVAFVESRKEWILQSLHKMKAYEIDYTLFDENTKFETRSFKLSIQKVQRNDVRLHLDKGVLNVYYPAHIKVQTPAVQEAIRFGIVEALRREAKRYLPARLDYFARLHNFSYQQLFIKNLKSRWGSCSSVNNINLNLHLMRLPNHLIDYVILHELCHTVEKNHGPGFWSLLDKYTNGRSKLLAQEMKQYRTTIY